MAKGSVLCGLSACALLCKKGDSKKGEGKKGKQQPKP